MTLARWRMALWAAMLLVVAWLVWNARGALIPFAFGAVLAYTLTPVVDRIAGVLPGREPRWTVWRRGFAVLLIYACFGAALFGVGTLVVPVLADQAAEFVETLPTLVDDARVQVDEWLQEYQQRVPPEAQERIDGYAEDAGDALSSAMAGAARRSVGLVTGTLTIVFGFAVVPFWLFYALRDRHSVSGNFMNAVPPEARDDARNVLTVCDRVLGRYLRGQLILGVIVGTAVGVALTLMDVPMSLALGLFAGITELIPIIGPWIGAVPGLIIVAAIDPGKLPWVALVYFAVQQLENHLLVPRIQGQAVDIHPGMVILLLVVGGASFGFIGLLVVVPLAAILRELFWYADRRLRGLTPSQAMIRSRATHADPPPSVSAVASEPDPASDGAHLEDREGTQLEAPPEGQTPAAEERGPAASEEPTSEAARR